MVNTKEANKHIAMILDPMEWPRWPVLPMKNPARYNTQTPDHGVILAVEGYYSNTGAGPIYLWHTNMFLIPTKEVKNSANDGTHKVIDFGMLGDACDIYPDAEAVVEAGWQVD